jgi:hypothetical protein
MNDLRQATEMALKYFEDAYGLERRLQSRKHFEVATTHTQET